MAILLKIITVLLKVILWCVFGLVVAVPLLIIIAAIAADYLNRKSIKIVSATACPKCGRIVGREAVLEAIEARKQMLRELTRRHPFSRFRISQVSEIHCPHCGFVFRFHWGRNCVVAARESAGPAEQLPR